MIAGVFRGFLALLAGFVTMAFVVVLATAVLQKRAPAFVGAQGSPRPAYVAVNLGYSFLGAAAGGYVTAWIADLNPLHTALALAIVVLAMGAISALQARGKQPVWYQVALLIISPLGVVAGGILRMRMLGLI